MNKSQAENNFYAFNTALRVDVNDVKPFKTTTGRLPADHFLDPLSMAKLFKITNRMLIQTLLLLILFHQFTTGVRLVTRIPT